MMMKIVSGQTIVILFLVMTVFACKNRNTGIDQNRIDEQTLGTLAYLNLMIAEDTANAELYNQRARYYLQKDQINNALNDINKTLSIDPNNVDYLITLSDIYLQMGQTENVTLTLHRAIDLEADNPKPYISLGKLYIVLENYQLAFDYFDQAIFLDDLDPEPYFLKGYANLEKGDTSLALEYFQTSVERDQDYIKGYVELGSVMLDLNNSLAIDYFINAVDLEPENAEVIYMLGLSYQTFGLLDDALETYHRLLEIDSTYFKAEYNIGFISLVYLEEFEQAVNHFSRAIELNPDFFEAFYNRGLCYEILGDYNKAREDYQQLLDIHANYQRAIEGLNRLDQVQ